MDDYFARCRLAAFDPRALNALNRDEKEFLALGAKDLTVTHADIASLPLAQVGANKSLPLTQGVNPAWAGAIATLQAVAVKPLLGDKTSLTEADWAALLAKLGPFEAWSGGKAGGSVEKIGLKRVREILATKAKETLTALVAKDKAEEGHAQAVIGLNRLVHYHRDLGKLCNNFVNFRDFYGRKDKAIFQAGTLYLDQRSCDLCITVEDAGKHAAMAGLAGTYLAYCDCYRKGTGRRCRLSPRSPGATRIISWSAATASSTTARAVIGMPPSPRLWTTRSASGRPSGRRTRSWSGQSRSGRPSRPPPRKPPRPPSWRRSPRPRPVRPGQTRGTQED